MVAAIRGAQADTVRYPEFVKSSTAAGVIGYLGVPDREKGDLLRQERRTAYRGVLGEVGGGSIRGAPIPSEFSFQAEAEHGPQDQRYAAAWML